MLFSARSEIRVANCCFGACVNEEQSENRLFWVEAATHDRLRDARAPSW